MNILALDLPGTREGAWALYGTDEQRVLETGAILLSPTRAEILQFRDLGVLLDRLHRAHRFRVVVLEHPFIHIIAGWVGAVKMWASRQRAVTWYMITASSAKKTVFGNGRLGKTEVLVGVASARWASPCPGDLSCHLSHWTQHQADAAMYARAYAVKHPHP